MSKTYVVLHTGDDMLEYYEDETAYLEEGGLKGSVATRYAKVKPVTPMVLTSQTMATTSQSKTSLMATESLNLLVNLNVKALKGEICRCKRFKHPITMPQSDARGLILRCTLSQKPRARWVMYHHPTHPIPVLGVSITSMQQMSKNALLGPRRCKRQSRMHVAADLQPRCEDFAVRKQRQVCMARQA